MSIRDVNIFQLATNPLDSMRQACKHLPVFVLGFLCCENSAISASVVNSCRWHLPNNSCALLCWSAFGCGGWNWTVHYIPSLFCHQHIQSKCKNIKNSFSFNTWPFPRRCSPRPNICALLNATTPNKKNDTKNNFMFDFFFSSIEFFTCWQFDSNWFRPLLVHIYIEEEKTVKRHYFHKADEPMIKLNK